MQLVFECDWLGCGCHEGILRVKDNIVRIECEDCGAVHVVGGEGDNV